MVAFIEMKLVYGKKWFGAKMRMTETWTEAQACEAHLARKPYAALAIDENDSLKYVLQFATDFVAVGHFDELGREYLLYHFEEKEPERLFLAMVVNRDFEELTPRIIRGTIFTFKQDGTVLLEEQDLISHTKTTCLAEKPIDVSQNWEPYPKFGDYTSIGRVERVLMQTKK